MASMPSALTFNPPRCADWNPARCHFQRASKGWWIIWRSLSLTAPFGCHRQWHRQKKTFEETTRTVRKRIGCLGHDPTTPSIATDLSSHARLKQPFFTRGRPCVMLPSPAITICIEGAAELCKSWFDKADNTRTNFSVKPREIASIAADATMRQAGEDRAHAHCFNTGIESHRPQQDMLKARIGFR